MDPTQPKHSATTPETNESTQPTTSKKVNYFNRALMLLYVPIKGLSLKATSGYHRLKERKPSLGKRVLTSEQMQRTVPSRPAAESIPAPKLPIPHSDSEKHLQDNPDHTHSSRSFRSILPSTITAKKRLKNLQRNASVFSHTSLRLVKILLTVARRPSIVSPTPERTQKLLTALGTTFQKLGQCLCTVIDDPDYKKHLEKCLGDNPPMTDKAFEHELNKQIQKANMTDIQIVNIGKHLGTGSVAETRLVTVIINGEQKQVVAKIIKPDAENQIKTDRRLIRLCTKILSHVAPSLANPHICDAVDRFLATLEDETNLQQEAENAKTMAEFLDNHSGEYPEVNISRPIEGGYCKGLLLMEEVKGTTLAKSSVPPEQKNTMRHEAFSCWRDCLEQTGFFHADLHDGNLMISPDGSGVSMIDFGNCGRLTQLQSEAVRQLGNPKNTSEMTANILCDLGEVKLEPTSKMALIKKLEPYANRAPTSKDLLEMINIAGNAGIKCPASAIALLKTDVYINAA